MYRLCVIIVSFFVLIDIYPSGLYGAKGDVSEGKTAPAVIYIPQKVVFWNAAYGLKYSRTVILRQGDGHALKLKGVKTSGRYIDARVVKDEGTQRKVYFIEVNLGKDAPPGPIEGMVRIETNHPEMKDIDIPVIGNVLDGLIIVPATVSMRLSRSKRHASGALRLSNPDGRKFNILNVGSSLKALKTDVKPLKGENGYRITLSIDDPEMTLKKLTKAVVHIQTDYAPQRLVVAPVWIVSP